MSLRSNDIRSRLPTPSARKDTLKRGNIPLSEIPNIASKKSKLENVPPRRPLLRRSVSMAQITLKKTFSLAPKIAPVRPVAVKTKTVAPVTTGPSAGSKTRRAPWDYKGKAQDLEEILTTVKAERDKLRSHVSELEIKNVQLEHQVESQGTEILILRKNYETEMNKLKHCQHELSSIKERFHIMEQENECLKESVESVTKERENMLIKNEEQCKEFSEMKKCNDCLQVNIDVVTTKLQTAEKQCNNLQVSLREAMDKIHFGEKLRRDMHNTILDLKGNIRVFCRVRPLLGNETETNVRDNGCITFPDPDQRTVAISSSAAFNAALNESSAGNAHRNNHEFVFDKVFSTTATQEDVFDEISQLVQSALDGYNVCIFAYGPTGSGKTFTMEGAKGNYAQQEGMIPKSLQQIFTAVKDMKSNCWKFELEASFIEIYKEEVHDLLKPKNGKLTLRLNDENEVFVSGLSHTKVTSIEQVYHLLNQAQRNRAVAETNCNARSSRSHSIFQLNINGFNSETSERCRGVLSLIDLAGSERVKVSGSEGERFEEAKSINKSLSNLGNVIMALSQKKEHVPFRNSKLTYLLMNSLKNNSKVLMFINVSPNEESYSETLTSLRFAKMVNDCCVGPAVKRVKM